MSTKEEAEKLNQQFKGLTDEHLLSLMANRVPGSIDAIMAKRELTRRERLEQYELNLKLVAEQERWMKSTTKLTAVYTTVSTLAGAAVGALLTWWLK